MTFKATLVNGEARARHNGRETIDVSLGLNSTHTRRNKNSIPFDLYRGRTGRHTCTHIFAPAPGAIQWAQRYSGITTTTAVTIITIIGSERSFQAAPPFSIFPSQKEFAYTY